MAVKAVLAEYNLGFSELHGITTDGAKAMTGRVNGFTALLLEEVATVKSKDDVIVSHCIIHQENLCAKVLNMEHVMKEVVSTVNFIRARGLNHRQFQSLLLELDSDHADVIYFSAVRWLSRGSTLKRFWQLLPEITVFMEGKGKDTERLQDVRWIDDLAFFVDITQHLSQLNIKLQGRAQLACDMYDHVCCFERKLDLFRNQLRQGDTAHFELLSSRNIPDFDKYVTLVEKLQTEFGSRFGDFKAHSKSYSIFARPLDVIVETAPADMQLELIEMQSSSNLQAAFKQTSLESFYRHNVPQVTFPRLHRHAVKMISLFASSYMCEQLFSRMKYTKSSCRSALTDEHLQAILRISTTNLAVNFDDIVEDKQCQSSH